MFYTFRQNNSGGDFHVDENVAHTVIIEGDTIEEITKRAQEIGIYFDGCENGFDCHCCGDRWSEPWGDDKLQDKPCLSYGDNSVFDYLNGGLGGMAFTPRWAHVVIHYRNGDRRYFVAEEIGTFCPYKDSTSPFFKDRADEKRTEYRYVEVDQTDPRWVPNN